MGLVLSYYESSLLILHKLNPEQQKNWHSNLLISLVLSIKENYFSPQNDITKYYKYLQFHSTTTLSHIFKYLSQFIL